MLKNWRLQRYLAHNYLTAEKSILTRDLDLEIPLTKVVLPNDR